MQKTRERFSEKTSQRAYFLVQGWKRHWTCRTQ